MNNLRSTVGAVSLAALIAVLTVVLVGARTSVFGATGNTVRGKELYTDHCSACHQGGGQGVAGTFPPLKGSGVVNKDDATKQVHIVLEGLQGAKAGGVAYMSAMPAFDAALSDADIADVVNYVRGSWGNHGKPVTAAQVAAVRAAN